MKIKEQVFFDIREEKFKYLHHDEDKKQKRVDITDLTKRLDRDRKKNTFNNTKIIFYSFLCLSLFALISLKF
jgi:hypothetical protein